MSEHKWLDREQKCDCGWKCVNKAAFDQQTQWSLHKAVVDFNERGHRHVDNYFEEMINVAYRECANVLGRFEEKLRLNN